MSTLGEGKREGSLEAPTRHTLDWRSETFNDEEDLFKELERVYDICHGCRRCVSLCNSFPTLFDLVDEACYVRFDVQRLLVHGDLHAKILLDALDPGHVLLLPPFGIEIYARRAPITCFPEGFRGRNCL